jgi:hypothetical protein
MHRDAAHGNASRRVPVRHHASQHRTPRPACLPLLRASNKAVYKQRWRTAPVPGRACHTSETPRVQGSGCGAAATRPLHHAPRRDASGSVCRLVMPHQRSTVCSTHVCCGPSRKRWWSAHVEPDRLAAHRAHAAQHDGRPPFPALILAMMKHLLGHSPSGVWFAVRAAVRARVQRRRLAPTQLVGAQAQGQVPAGLALPSGPWS